MRIGAAFFAFLLRAGQAESAVDGATQASIVIPIHFHTPKLKFMLGNTATKVDSPEPNLI